jgi:hypothetical protein
MRPLALATSLLVLACAPGVPLEAAAEVYYRYAPASSVKPGAGLDGSVGPGPLTVTATAGAALTGPGIVGDMVDTVLVARDAKAPVSFVVTSGALPPGLQLSSDGSLTGTYEGTGSTSAVVTATDAAGRSGQITIEANLVTPTASIKGLPTFLRSLGSSTGTLSTNLVGAGWSLGSVPSDLALSLTGPSVSVTAPSVASRTVYSITATATRATGATANGEAKLEVYPPVGIAGIAQSSYTVTEGQSLALTPNP